LDQHQIFIKFITLLFLVKMNVDLDDIEIIKETSLTIRGTRRRTTVPKDIVDKLELMNGDKIRWILFKDGKLLVSKVKKTN